MRNFLRLAVLVFERMIQVASTAVVHRSGPDDAVRHGPDRGVYGRGLRAAGDEFREYAEDQAVFK
jgi:hypothetical protein